LQIPVTRTLEPDNAPFHLLTETVKPTSILRLHFLSNTELPTMWHKVTVDKLLVTAAAHETWGLHDDTMKPPQLHQASVVDG